MNTCYTTYYILIVFFIDLFVHILFHAAQQSLYILAIKQKDDVIRQQVKQERMEMLIDELKRQRQGEKINKRRKTKEPKYLKDTDPIVISINLKISVLTTTLSVIIIYGLLVLNIILNKLNFIFPFLQNFVLLLTFF